MLSNDQVQGSRSHQKSWIEHAHGKNEILCGCLESFVPSMLPFRAPIRLQFVIASKLKKEQLVFLVFWLEERGQPSSLEFFPKKQKKPRHHREKQRACAPAIGLIISFGQESRHSFLPDYLSPTHASCPTSFLVWWLHAQSDAYRRI